MKISEILARAKSQMSENSTSIAALAVTAGAAGLVAYAGGKALLTTVAVAGGGAFALAVTYQVAKGAVSVASGVASGFGASVSKAREAMDRPAPASAHGGL